MSFADPTSDIAFKKIFGSQQRSHILISFLNAALGFTGKAAIAELEIVAPYQVPHLKGFLESTLDVRAKDKAGREFIVEMQVEDNKNFAKRACYYTAKAYSQQLKKKEKYATLRPVFFLGILSFNFFEGDDFLTRHLILNQKTQKQELGEFEFAFIELKKFNKKESELSDIIDKWTYFLKHAGSLKKAPKSLTKIPEINEAFEVADQHLWTPEELHIYEYWEEKERTRLSALESAQVATREAQEATREAQEATREAQEATREAQEAATQAKNEAQQEKTARKKAEADKVKAEAEKKSEAKARKKAETDKQRIALSSAEMLRTAQVSEDRIRQATGIAFAQLDAWIRSGRP